MATNNKQQVNIGAWDAMMAKVAGMPEIEQLVAEVDRLRAREQALEAENDAAIDELEWQRDINQQLGQENEQKQTMIDAMRLVVEAVAADLFINIDTYERCGWRDGCRPVWSEHFAEWRHAPDCPVTQARAYVAAHPAAGEAVESEGE